MQNLVLVFLERRRDVPLASGNRLLADVVVGRVGEIRLGDLDVIPEHPVVADLQRRDPGAGAFGFFHRRNGGLAAAADHAQFVDFGIDAVTDDATVTRDGRRLVEQRVFDQIAQIGEVIKFGEQAEHERCLQRRQDAAKFRQE